MKKITKGNEPAALKTFKQQRPNATWDDFRINTKPRKALADRLTCDQGGLCAYCEIDLREAASASDADFRVEHFHPKSDRGGHNWDLDWQNLLACCHGGSQSSVPDRSTRRDHSCDIPKHSQVLDNVILNPLTLPTGRIFKVSRASGAISVDPIQCATLQVDPDKAQNTLDKLNLNATRLKGLRKAVLEGINKKINALQQAGKFDVATRDRLAKSCLGEKTNNWLPFFTSRRSYLGQSAEKYLASIKYNG